MPAKESSEADGSRRRPSFVLDSTGYLIHFRHYATMFDAILELLSGPLGIFILGGFYVSIVVGERLFTMVRRYAFDDRDARCSVGLNLISSMIGIALGVLIPLGLYILVYDQFRLFAIDSLWLAVPMAFIVLELAYYWEHRLSHRVGILWAFHTVHHSSNQFNHTTAARGFVLDGQLKGLFALSAALMGIDPKIIIAVEIVKNAFGIWNHASYVGHLGPLEKWLMTPFNHKVHHANQPEYIDRNYGQVLLIWDHLFGSHAPYGREPVVGLVNQVHNNNPLTAQFEGFVGLRKLMAAADNWSDKIAYLWRPPEWSHDGECRSDCPKYASMQQA